MKRYRIRTFSPAYWAIGILGWLLLAIIAGAAGML